MQMPTRWSRLAPFIVIAALAACGDDGTSVDPATAVASVTIEAPRTALSVGSTLQLSATAANAAGTILTGRTIDWISSRPDVATITSDGLVRGVGSGATVISAASGGHEATVSLSVQRPSSIVLTSDAGDYIGGGRTYTYTKASATIQVTATATAVEVRIAGDQDWNGHFQVPSGSQLTPRTQFNGTRWPFQGAGAGLSWSGEGRGCNTLTGFFVVDSLRWSGAEGSSSLEAIALRFEQHCEGAGPALRGTITWRADDPTVAAGPVTPIPSTVWRPPAGAIPATGNLVYLQSDGGDYIGQGATTLYQTGLSAAAAGRHLTVSAGGYTMEFEGMNSLTQVQTGYYGDLMRYPFHNPIRGGLSVSGNGRGCNTLTGWVAVDRVNYAGTSLVGIEMRFEQHCEGLAPALRGMVRWGQLPG
jgi:hypothetical protein